MLINVSKRSDLDLLCILYEPAHQLNEYADDEKKIEKINLLKFIKKGEVS